LTNRRSGGERHARQDVRGLRIQHEKPSPRTAVARNIEGPTGKAAECFDDRGTIVPLISTEPTELD